MHDGMRVGELAAHFGLNPKTIRYYEEIGLLKRAGRSASGYRLYTQRDVERVGFIRRAKMLGLSLDEIRDILSVQQTGSPPCGQVLDLIDLKISTIDQRIADLVAFRADLATRRSVWTDEDERVRRAATPACICPIIEQQTEVEDYPHAASAFEPAMHR